MTKPGDDDRKLSVRRLRETLEAYGASPERWPDAERAAALTLLSGSDEARRSWADAASLDALLDRSDPPPHPSSGLIERLSAIPTVPSTSRQATSDGLVGRLTALVTGRPAGRPIAFALVGLLGFAAGFGSYQLADVRTGNVERRVINSADTQALQSTPSDASVTIPGDSGLPALAEEPAQLIASLTVTGSEQAIGIRTDNTNPPAPSESLSGIELY